MLGSHLEKPSDDFMNAPPTPKDTDAAITIPTA